MVSPSSKYLSVAVFRTGFLFSWVAAVPLVLNILVFVGLAAILVKRWAAAPAYLLVVVAALLAGSATLWMSVWKEPAAIRAIARPADQPAAPPSADERENLKRSAAALMHLAGFYWAMGAFLTALVIDQPTRWSLRIGIPGARQLRARDYRTASCSLRMIEGSAASKAFRAAEPSCRLLTLSPF